MIQVLINFLDSTDYSSAYKLEYPVSYIAAGQREGYQQVIIMSIYLLDILILNSNAHKLSYR